MIKYQKFGKGFTVTYKKMSLIANTIAVGTTGFVISLGCNMSITTDPKTSQAVSVDMDPFFVIQAKKYEVFAKLFPLNIVMFLGDK